MTQAIINLTNGKSIKLNLDAECAPISVENFIKHAESDFYNGLIFHRIIPNFMVQGGGMDVDMNEKRSSKPIKGEFLANGVNNTRKHKAGTISMARTMVKDSATTQFFICSVDTPHLDGQYASFGEVADEDSLKVVQEMSFVPTTRKGYYDDVPVEPIIIKNIEIIKG